MVRIPAGPFLMGGDPKRDPNAQENEQPQITIELPGYFMGKYPVTVEEYRVFVERGGYDESAGGRRQAGHGVMSRKSPTPGTGMTRNGQTTHAYR